MSVRGSGVGRKPVPTNLRILRGNPGKRPLPKEPKYKEIVEIPKAPKYLNKVGKQEWKRAATILTEVKVLTENDIQALGAYCVNYQTWVDCIAKLQEEGLTTIRKNSVMVSPYFVMSNQLSKEMRAYWTEFGMTPSSRTKVQATPQEKDDEFDKFLKKN